MTTEQEWQPRSIEDHEERAAEIRAEIQNLSAEYEGRKFDDAARTRWNRLNDELRQIESTRTELVQRKNRLRELAGNPNAQERGAPPVGNPGEVATRDTSRPWRPGGPPPPLWPSQNQLRQLHTAVRNGTTLRLALDEERAAVLSSSTGADQLATQLSVSTRQPRRIAGKAAIPSQNVAGTQNVEYSVFGAGSAAITAEGSAKAEYSNISAGSATPQVINIWTDTSRQNLLTMTNFEAKLRNVLAAKVANREDQLLVDTVLGNTGIQLMDATTLGEDTLLEAAAKVAASDVGAEPNLAVVNPADIPVVLGPNVGTGGSASPAFAEFLPTVHGMSVYPSNHVNLGDAIVGAWPAASRFVVGIQPSMLVDNVSQIKNNLVTLLQEEAVALAIDEPEGFVHITEST